MSRYCHFIGICWSKYVLDIKDLELRIEPIEGMEQTQELICCSDGDYAQDDDNKSNISGLMLNNHGIPVRWRCKALYSIELPRFKAEWVVWIAMKVAYMWFNHCRVWRSRSNSQ